MRISLLKVMLSVLQMLQTRSRLKVAKIGTVLVSVETSKLSINHGSLSKKAVL